MAVTEGRTTGRTLLIALIVVALLAAAFWAGRVTVGGAAMDTATADRAVTVEVAEGRVGRSITLTTTVSQKAREIAANALAGTVTSVTDDGEIQQGQTLYSVDLVPVRAVVGTLPFYRDLGPSSQGEDVRQLQNALRHLGHLNSAADGRYAAATERAVRAWQRALGREQTGTVARGELVAIPTLPAAVRLDRDLIGVGRQVTGGEMAVLAPDGEPAFTMQVNPAQAQMIPAEAAVTVTSGEHRWPAVIVERTDAENGMVNLALRAPDGGVVCGAECEEVVGAGEVTLLTEVVIVPEVSGPSLPLAAVVTDVQGRTTVQVAVDATAAAGDAAAQTETRQVTVLGVQDGVAVVDGLTAGETVLLPRGTSDGALTDSGPATDTDTDPTTHPTTDPAPVGTP